MHTSLDQALGRQPRLNRVGQSLLNIGSGASAAYSLRSLTGGEPKAVRIRRDGDNEERDFTTAEIVNEAAAWTNGLQETALPADLGVTSFTTSALGDGLSSSGVSLAGGASLDDFDGTFTPNSDGTVWSNGSALGVNYAFGADSWVLNFNDGTNSGSISISSTAKYPFEVTNWGSAGVSSGVSGLAEAWDQGFTDTYLDFAPTYGATTTYPTAEVAYSLRKVRSTYTGPAVRIRRTSDDIDADVAFDTNDTVSNDSIVTEVISGNQSTLQAFISGTNAAVATWYDQSGNSRNATQATDANQPLIAQSGSYLGELSFDGSNHALSIATISTLGIDGSNNKSAFAVARTTAGTDGFVIAGMAGGSSFQGLRYRSNATNGLARVEISSFGVEGGDLSDGNNHVYSSIFDGTQTKDFDVSLDGSITQGSGTDVINTDGTATFFIGTVTSNSDAGFTREFILYASDQTSNRTAIETNIANEYGITLS